MKEGIYLQRLDALYDAFSDNSLTFGRQLAQIFARVGAHEELFATGPEDAGFFRSRWLIFRNRLLTVLAPGLVGDLLTKRENEILAAMKERAEQRILDGSVADKGLKGAEQPVPTITVERVEDPKKMRALKSLCLVVLVALSAAGCATKGQIARYRTEGFNQANAQCLDLQGRVQQYLSGLQVRLVQFETRLRDLNQLDDSGDLRFGDRSNAKAAAAGQPSPTSAKQPTATLRVLNGVAIPAEATVGGAK